MKQSSKDSYSTLPVLYSFRRCPYAMRARMGLKISGVTVHLREILLRSKPSALLQCSGKGTVPVLVLSDGTVIDESRDVMVWALSINDPEQWLPKQNKALYDEINTLLDVNDFEFKNHLDHYKYADRFPEHPEAYYRAQGEQFLLNLEERLNNYRFLIGDNVSLADIGIFPFIRQFANVDTDWFYQSQYRKLQNWLDELLQSQVFNTTMEKYKPWTEEAEPLVF